MSEGLKNRLRDQLFDIARAASGQINQDKIDNITTASTSIVSTIESFISEGVTKQVELLKKASHRGFKNVAKDVAEVRASLSQLSSVLVKTNEELDELSQNVRRLQTRLSVTEDILLNDPEEGDQYDSED